MEGANEVLEDRGLEVKAQISEVIKVESGGEEVVQVTDEERLNAQVPESLSSQ